MDIVEYKETPPIVEDAEMLATSKEIVETTTMLRKYAVFLLHNLLFL